MAKWLEELTSHIEAAGVELTKKELYRSTPLYVNVETNVKRKGTLAYDRFFGYFCEGVVSIGDAFDMGLRQDDIRHDAEHGFILLGDAANEAFAALEKEEEDARMVDWTLLDYATPVVQIPFVGV